MIISCIAELCHEVNRIYCESHGDFSQVPWEQAPQWQKESALNGVLFHIQNPNAGPSASHDNWMREKVEQGWVWGPVKDPERKEHPCIVPYEALPEQQRYKDHLFVTIVKACRK